MNRHAARIEIPVDPSRSERIIDPSGLSRAQLSGMACVICHKGLGDLVAVGTFPDGLVALACADHEIAGA